MSPNRDEREYGPIPESGCRPELFPEISESSRSESMIPGIILDPHIPLEALYGLDFTLEGLGLGKSSRSYQRIKRKINLELACF